MKTGLKVLVVGSGGREHALALRLLSSKSVVEVIACPGNAGLVAPPADLAHKVLRCAAGAPLDVALSESVDLVVIGPEIPLCEGLSDTMRSAGLHVYGPSKAAAQLEGSKAYMKDFCRRHGIDTAREVVLNDLSELEHGLSQFDTPPVVKADGLCAGKGVVVAESMQEARQAATEMLSGAAFGAAGQTLVLEERLLGAEASIHAICDGERALLLPVAQDHKRIFEGDQGPNTGGMGTYAPAPLVDAALLKKIETEVVQKVVDGMKADAIPFIGTLFVGLMINEKGEAKVLEFNVRFGDPETQVLTLIADGDWGEALLAAALGELRPNMLQISKDHALCVVLAAENYPATPTKGDTIYGVSDAEALPGVRVFQAGTKRQGADLVTSGGRVLGVTARGTTLREARERAYAACDAIDFRGKQLRHDIGYRALS